MNISELSIRRPVLSQCLPLSSCFLDLSGIAISASANIRQWIIPSFRYPAPTRVQMPMLSKTRLPNHWSKTSMVSGNPFPCPVSANKGSSRITVEFELSVDLETAANDVRDKVSRAQRYLPRDC